ncbi:serine/threonine-protein kinase [Arenibaculum pallidiluteum]|uniref:serine/threonine-protein kinase n=1 Tax=Arenibaculum pallidiluteum TaxID=2812559 RepID=UPI001A976121|nr:serine/threonine-protein kinase [Arenibaculum pallidiluteum]
MVGKSALGNGRRPDPDDEGTVFFPHSSRDDAAPDLPNAAGPGVAGGRTAQSGAGAGDDDTIRIGDTLKDRFVIESLLGSGGMGKVFMAVDLRKKEASDRNPYVAIKILKENLKEHPSSAIALQREARKAQDLSHPNIIKVYDFDRDGERFFITMEYLTGRSLDKIIRAPNFRQMPQAEAGRIVNAVGAALSFAHANGIVHSDLKPGNIFITDAGKVKVIDFGLARVIKHNMQAEEDATAFDVRSLGAMTPAYASPEMLELQPTQPRDDVYALACITYELLAGRHPFGRMPATHARDAGMRPARIKSLRSDQWHALERALDFDADRRLATVDALIEGLALGAPRKRSAARAISVGAGFLGLAAAAALAVWTLTGGSPADDAAEQPMAQSGAQSGAQPVPQRPGPPQAAEVPAQPPRSPPTPAPRAAAPTPGSAPVGAPTGVPTGAPTGGAASVQGAAPPPAPRPTQPEARRTQEAALPPPPPAPQGTAQGATALPPSLSVPVPPALPAAAPVPRGVERVPAAVFRSWCGAPFRLDARPDRWSFALPGGEQQVFAVERYEFAEGRLAVHAMGPRGRRTVTEFGGFSPDFASMVHLRMRTEGEAGWRDYNRPFRTC